MVRWGDGRTGRLLSVPGRSTRLSAGAKARVVLGSGAVVSVPVDELRVSYVPGGAHGSISTYNKKGCRCDLCQATAARVRKRQRERQRFRERPAVPPVSTGNPGDVDCSWMDEAACKTVSTDVFFPAVPYGHHAAVLVCQTCPVQMDCLRYARATDQPAGIWGGRQFPVSFRQSTEGV